MSFQFVSQDFFVFWFRDVPDGTCMINSSKGLLDSLVSPFGTTQGR
jgi:hypothetical protein